MIQPIKTAAHCLSALPEGRFLLGADGKPQLGKPVATPAKPKPVDTHTPAPIPKPPTTGCKTQEEQEHLDRCTAFTRCFKEATTVITTTRTLVIHTWESNLVPGICTQDPKLGELSAWVDRPQN